MRKQYITEDWMPSESTLLKMMADYPEVNIQYEKEKFVDYYLANGGVSANWEATFRNWIRRSDEYQRRNSQSSTSHASTSTNSISDRRNRILSVAKQGDTGSDGKIKRLPKRK
jgi:hypothetical protein